MRYDHAGRPGEVRRAPRIVVPNHTSAEPGHYPLRIMTTLHYCEPHQRDFDLGAYWTDAIKARVERRARPAFAPTSRPRWSSWCW